MGEGRRNGQNIKEIRRGKKVKSGSLGEFNQQKEFNQLGWKIKKYLIFSLSGK